MGLSHVAFGRDRPRCPLAIKSLSSVVLSARRSENKAPGLCYSTFPHRNTFPTLRCNNSDFTEASGAEWAFEDLPPPGPTITYRVGAEDIVRYVIQL